MILGLIYQAIQLEGEKNKKGSYYTSRKVTDNMTNDFDFAHKELFLDPCCGSGAFLLSLNNVKPEQIFGCDRDKIAVMIAKINLLLKFPNYEFIPQIYCLDYLNEDITLNDGTLLSEKQFDYIATNPPWGAQTDILSNIKEIASGESFSYFFVKAYSQLKEHGCIRFLLPEAILNVKNHKDIRKFILEHTKMASITFYDDLFTGVTTKYIDIKCYKEKPSKEIDIIIEGKCQKNDIASFLETENNIFCILSEKDSEIIHMVKKKGKYNLSNSIWALGIVTGNNKEKLLDNPKDGYEIIYTGKEIFPYVLKKGKKYVHFDKSQFQQSAKEEYYRISEKLVYKFISKKPIFAYDNTKSLFLNSANILVPNIHGMNIKTVMAFLNSELFQFYYMKLFQGVKILRGNLSEIPFPEIDEVIDKKITNIVDDILNGNESKIELLQKEIYDIYNISNEQKKYIRKCLYSRSEE